MTGILAMALLYLLLLMPAHAQAPDEPWALGKAWSADGETLLYRELHYRDEPDDDLPSRVIYRAPYSEELLAEKSIDTEVSAVAPAIDHHDLRTGARLTTSYSENDDMVTVRFREHNSERVREQRFETGDEPLIIDAGFDAFVRRHWDRLTAGERVNARFLVATRMDAIGIAVREVDAERCPGDIEPLTCLIAEPTGLLRLAGLFVEPALLGYETDERRLRLFRGNSNLPEEDGDNRRVLIRYEYPGGSGTDHAWAEDSPVVRQVASDYYRPPED